MPWARLDPAKVAEQLRASFGPDLEILAEQALAHMRQELLGGRYVVVQDEHGHTFIGTPEEAAEHMLGVDYGDGQGLAGLDARRGGKSTAGVE